MQVCFYLRNCQYNAYSYSSCVSSLYSIPVEEGQNQKTRQRSSRLYGGQNLFNSLPRQLFCLGLFEGKGRIHPIFLPVTTDQPFITHMFISLLLRGFPPFFPRCYIITILLCLVHPYITPFNPLTPLIQPSALCIPLVYPLYYSIYPSPNLQPYISPI